MSESIQRTARILSIDGGGLRGIIPAVALEYIESQIQCKITERFHMISGTSTGGIIAAGLQQYSAKELKDLYLYHGAELFQRRSFFSNPCGLFKSKYKTDPIYNSFKRFFGENELKDVQYDLLVPYYDLTNRTQRFFKSHRARINQIENYKIYDVVRATSAAPTYFEPHHLHLGLNNNQEIQAIDGGVFCNDPGLYALTEAVETYPNADSYFILSIGTGKHMETLDPRSLISWAEAIPDIFLSNTNDTVRHTMKEFGAIYSKPVIFCRIQVPLPPELAEMDNVDNLPALANITIPATQERIQKALPYFQNPMVSREQIISDSPVPTNFFEIK